MESAGVWYLGTGHYLSPGRGGGEGEGGAEEFRGDLARDFKRVERGSALIDRH